MSRFEFWRIFVIISTYIFGHRDLDLWSKVTKFNRVRAKAISNQWAKTASKSVHSFGWNFGSQAKPDRHTNTRQWPLAHHYSQLPSTLGLSNIGLSFVLGWRCSCGDSMNFPLGLILCNFQHTYILYDPLSPPGFPWFLDGSCFI